MPNTAHGQVRITRCGDVICAHLAGSFNQEGSRLFAEAVRHAWREAGQPARWAFVVDARRWEGGTPDSFANAAAITAWVCAHGAVAIARVFTGKFLARVVDNQEVMRDAHVPILTCESLDAAWDWLEARGIACAPCRASLIDSTD